MPAKQTEEQLQRACLRWFRYQYPTLWRHLWHIPNGGSRNVTEAMKLKAMGVQAGVPDFFLSIPHGGYGGAFIELKTTTGRLSEHQAAFIEEHKGGYLCAVCRSVEEFSSVVIGYLRK